jgi:hypothetical protein
MASFNKWFIHLFLLLALASCRPMEEQGSGEPEIYTAVYVIEYVNNTSMDIELSDGYFAFPSENPLVPTGESGCRLTLGKNSTGTFTISWPYTWYFYVRETDPGFSERGDSISSFYLRLGIMSQDYLIAGWPEAVYSRPDILSYGHSYGMDSSAIGIINKNGEFHKYVFDDPDHYTKQNIDARARLIINSVDDITFEIIETPHPQRGSMFYIE